MLGFFLILFGVVTLAGWLILIKDWRDSADWQKVQALVRSSKPERKADETPLPFMNAKERWGIRLVYEYRIGAQPYVGRRLSALREPIFRSEARAAQFAERFTKGSTLVVLVDPDNPKRSVIDRQLRMSDLVLGFAGIIMVLIGFAL